jgi:hypothetical protein
MKYAKALILSKTGSKVASPKDTIIVLLNPLGLKIDDKTSFEMIKDRLWSWIDKN